MEAEQPGPHLLARWLKRVREQTFAHYLSEERFAKLHLYIGIPATLLSTIVGTAVFASLQKEMSGWAKILVGVVSIAAAVLVALQTFLNFSQRAEKHRVTGARYGAIRREIEVLLEFPNDPKTKDIRVIDAIRVELDKAAEDAPNVTSAMWTHATTAIENEGKR